MSENQRKLLFLAYPFPPLRTTACVRTWHIAKFLSRLGWHITVVTPHPSIWRKVDALKETAAGLTKEGIDQILTGHRWPWLWPERLKCWNTGLGWVIGGIGRTFARRLGINEEVGWLPEAEKSCSTLVPKDVDIILATGAPFLSFRLAKRLSLKLGKPYVLDYRDPWSGNPHAQNSRERAASKEEEILLKQATAVTLVSQSWASNLAKRFPHGPKISVVHNGYDGEALSEIQPYSFDHFAIVYAGTFYPPKRDISPVMDALSRLQKTTKVEDKKWRFHYYGDESAHVLAMAKRFQIERNVDVHGNVPREEVLAAIRGAGIAVTITTITKDGTPEDMGIVPAKMFEAIGLGTPVLLLSPTGSDAEMIAQTTGLAGCFTGCDVNDITSFLHNVLNGKSPPKKSPELFDWTNLAKVLDNILRSNIKEGPSESEGFQAS